ncbi:hypothetical protein [Plebeiibacterium sediminum]|uniref:Uncharacterized protein n=1 Tax=Plebeiibacterium sediminum TaxID=2992112 RepID=A0AAE3SF72_9BACT|nr:hypothetical protein [Plebeiobacterium sediminum]MCW3786961.1 hypothetical protein [Plebeiobacterium sediminum]
MTFEDSEEQFNRIFEKSDRDEQIAKRYTAELERALYDIVIAHHPIIKEHIHDYLLNLFCILDKAKTEALDILQLCMSEDMGNTSLKVPKPLKKEEEEEKLKLQLKNIPDEGKAMYSEVFWETYHHKLKIEKYKIDIFNTVKKMLVTFYYEEILNMEGSNLIALNGMLYHSITIVLIQEIDMLAKEIRLNTKNTLSNTVK